MILENTSLESIGTAEDVLRRLVHERKMLESGAAVLATYREVSAALSALLAEQENAKHEVSVLKTAVNEIQEIKEKRLADLEAVLVQYKDSTVSKMQKEIDVLVQDTAALQDKYDLLGRQITQRTHEYDMLKLTQREEINNAQQHLDRIRAQHADLMRSINTAVTSLTSIDL